SESGEYGLIGDVCPHRCASLEYGIPDPRGLRCLYHGWLYDVTGQCLDQPGEPEGSDFCRKIRQIAYPCQERGSLILAYLGPGEPPLLPNYDFLVVPDESRFVSKYYQECNYWQGVEGNLDPVHNNLLHHPNHNLSHTAVGEAFRGSRGPVPGRQRLDCAETRFGVELCDTTLLDSGQLNMRTYNYIMPTMAVFPGTIGGKDGYSGNWHVPIDDTHHWKYSITFLRHEAIDRELEESRLGHVGPGYRLDQNKANRYRQDRSLLQTRSYTGIDSFAAQDTWATEGEGEIFNRTQEHLGSTDKIIVAARRMMLKGIEQVRAGGDPPHVVRDPAENSFPDIVVWRQIVPEGTDWQDLRRQAAQEIAASPSEPVPA
ncbi:MAG TPA: Rieske 2Fe-2S domain-containing protein, partial [Chloroflexota bacterium]|nr:Rieske 2Fe-2S domain-containing protein [Chloroflexota bacterium]